MIFYISGAYALRVEYDLQFLEKENARLELSMKQLLKELQLQKDQCDLMRDKATQLEMNLFNTKVHFLSYIINSSLGNYLQNTIGSTLLSFRLIFI